MRITIQHDAGSDRLLVVTDAAGVSTFVPPGKGRVIEGLAPFTAALGDVFPGWAAWTAAHGMPAPSGDTALRPITGQS